jgi:hypothetical protein
VYIPYISYRWKLLGAAYRGIAVEIRRCCMKKATYAKVIALIILGGVVLWSYCGDSGSIPIGKDAVIITGECVVINYDASLETWDRAKEAWLAAREMYPPKDSGHVNAY